MDTDQPSPMGGSDLKENETMYLGVTMGGD